MPAARPMVPKAIVICRRMRALYRSPVAGETPQRSDPGRLCRTSERLFRWRNRRRMRGGRKSIFWIKRFFLIDANHFTFYKM